jgi:phosphatidylglycerophosphate synthase
VGKVKVRPHLTGKIATVLQMTTVLWALLKWDALWLDVWTLGAAVFTGVSGFFYVWDGARQLGSHPASLPTEKK